MRNWIVAILILTAFGVFAAVKAEVDVSASFSFNELNDYGEWVNVGGYGRAWRPYAGPEWRPFLYGHWVWSSDGWLWESDEPFGWVVCHYGNWYYDNELGWVWVPGYDWSPARVEWRVTDNEVGWMPLLPPPIPGRPHLHRHFWTFCPTPVFTSVDVRSHVVVKAAPQADATVVVRRAPPRIEVIRSIVGAPIATVSLQKVVVRSHDRSFVRVEAGGSASERVVVPVGPQYRRTVTVRSTPASSTVRVESSLHRGVKRVIVTGHDREGYDNSGDVRNVEPPPSSSAPEVGSALRGGPKRVIVTGHDHEGYDNSGDVRNVEPPSSSTAEVGPALSGGTKRVVVTGHDNEGYDNSGDVRNAAPPSSSDPEVGPALRGGTKRVVVTGHDDDYNDNGKARRRVTVEQQ